MPSGRDIGSVCRTGGSLRESLQQRVEADREAGRQRVELLEREEHAVRERLAGGRVVTDRQQLPFAAEDHLLVRDEAREPYGVDHRVAADQLGGERSGTGRRVLLRL